jgi:glutathione synthase/RimK-type ligase-like ATP-grasp enzyme
MKFTLISEKSTLHSSNRLLTEAKALGLEVNHIAPYCTEMYLTHPQKNLTHEILFHRTTGIRFDEFDLNYTYLKEMTGATIFNPISSLKFLRDKELQILKLIEFNLPTVPSFSFRGQPTTSLLNQIERSLAPLLKNEQYILKTVRGNQGIGVMLINGKNSLLSILESFWGIKDQKFLIQPYIDAVEYRYFISKDQILAIIKKNSNNGFKGNRKHSEGELVLPGKLLELDLLALKSVSKCNLLYAGVDILQANNKNYILEINPVPGFKQVEELTKNNIAKTLIINAMERLDEK